VGAFRALACCVAVVAPFVAGCGFFCTDEARFSVVVEVVDAQGEPVPGATLRYVYEGGEPTAAQCSSRDANDVCTAWWIGSEETGMFIVTATAPGGASGTAIAFVGETDDGCHVETQERRVVVQ
jgi:hypothetical protein